MSNKISGSCLCGDVKYEIIGDIEGFFLCHCRRCRKGTGSAHASNLISHQAKLIWAAGKKLVKTFRLPSTLHTRSFCMECGSALPTHEGNLLVIPAGGIDSTLNELPTAHIYTKDKADWDEHLERVTAFDELPI